MSNQVKDNILHEQGRPSINQREGPALVSVLKKSLAAVAHP